MWYEVCIGIELVVQDSSIVLGEDAAHHRLHALVGEHDLGAAVSSPRPASPASPPPEQLCGLIWLALAAAPTPRCRSSLPPNGLAVGCEWVSLTMKMMRRMPKKIHSRMKLKRKLFPNPKNEHLRAEGLLREHRNASQYKPRKRLKQRNFFNNPRMKWFENEGLVVPNMIQ